MTTQDVKAFQQAVGTTHWKMDFNQFRERTGFVGPYAEQKWREWQELNKVLDYFDAETLAKIIGVS